MTLILTSQRQHHLYFYVVVIVVVVVVLDSIIIRSSSIIITGYIKYSKLVGEPVGHPYTLLVFGIKYPPEFILRQ